jgi:hypothetical protein
MKLTEKTPIFKLIAEREHEFYLGHIMEPIKQQILENQEIVERLREELHKLKNPKFTLNDGNIDLCNQWKIELLQSILGEKE